MKKTILGLGVVLVYIAYSVMSRHQATNLVIAPKSSTGQTTASTGSTSAAGSAGSSGGTSSSTPGSSSPASSTAAATYKDGIYTGSEADAFYGLVKVAITISGGKITDVTFLEHPGNNPNSDAINQQAMPYLKQETIQAQSANINGVSGATDTSQAFIQSLQSALNQAT